MGGFEPVLSGDAMDIADFDAGRDGHVYLTGELFHQYDIGLSVYQTADSLGSSFQSIDLGNAKDYFGNSYVAPTSLAWLDDGAVYVTGYFTGTFMGQNSLGGKDCFLVRLKPDMTTDWVVTWGGPMDDEAMSVSSDSNGNAYVFGDFRGTVDFDTSDSVYEVTSGGPHNGFILKVAPDSSSKWVRTLLSEGGVDPVKIITGETGCLFLLGTFHKNIDLDPTDGHDWAVAVASVWSSDIFLIKMLTGGTWN